MTGTTVITKTFILYEVYFIYTHTKYVYYTVVVQAVDLVISFLDSSCLSLDL